MNEANMLVKAINHDRFKYRVIKITTGMWERRGYIFIVISIP